MSSLFLTMTHKIISRLSQAVENKKVSQTNIAKKINKTPQYVHKMLRGKSPPTFELLICLRLNYDISIDYIIDGIEKDKDFMFCQNGGVTK